VPNRQCCVYILFSRPRGALYVGNSWQLARRMLQHKGFWLSGSAYCARFEIDKLGYFEIVADKDAALARERQLKRWARDWKIDLIEKTNPEWRDLTPRLIELLPPELL
jgi:putative endonuclease